MYKKVERKPEIRLTGGWPSCWSYRTQGRSLVFGQAASSGDKELRVQGINWQTQKHMGGAGNVASPCASAKPTYGFATRVRVMDHDIDLTARPTGTTGESPG